LLPAVDGFNVLALKPGTVTELLLRDSAGQQQRTFADKEGWFTLLDVAPGSYVLTTYNPMFVYPEVGMRATAAAVQAGGIQDHATAGSLHSIHTYQQLATEAVVYIKQQLQVTCVLTLACASTLPASSAHQQQR
jgi:hypothetical protein